MQRAELFSTAETPFQGLKSDRHPLTLGPGEAFDAQNMRCEPGQPITVREGIAPLLDTTGLPPGEFYGAAEPYETGYLWKYVIALKLPIDGKIHLFNRTFDKSDDTWDDWIEITRDGTDREDSYGDTRLEVPNSGNVQFTLVRAPYDDSPRIVVLDGSQTASIYTADGNWVINANAVNAPNEIRAHPVTAKMKDALDIANGNATGSGVVNNWVTAGRQGTAGSYYWEFKSATSFVSPAETVTITHDDDDAQFIWNFTTSQSKQLVLVAEYDDRSFWDTVKIEIRYNIGSGDVWKTVHDPTVNVPIDNLIEIATSTAGYKVLVFQLPDLTENVVGNTGTIDGIRITNSDFTPTTSSIKIHWIATSGLVPGGTEYACCRRQAVSLVDGPGVIYQQSGFGAEVPSQRDKAEASLNITDEYEFNARSRGCINDGASVPDDFIFPIDPRLFYIFDVPYSSPRYSVLQQSYGTKFVIFRKEPGESEFYRVIDLTVAFWDSNARAWVTMGAGSYPDDRESSDRDFRDRLPDEFTIPPPGGTALEFANNRLYAAAALSDGTGNKLMISEQGQPLRFRELVRMDTPTLADPASGFATKIEGENIRAIRAISESVQTPNGSAVLLFTDKNVYSVDRNVGGGAALFQLRKINSLGCSSGDSVAESDGNAIWLDKDRVIRSLDGSPLSLTNVDKKLQAVPVSLISRTSGIFYRGRYYFSYPTSTASNNDRVLVYSTVGGYWESDDLLPDGKAVQGWYEWWQEGVRRLSFFSASGFLYRYEAPGQTTDDGASIPFALETGEFHNQMFEPVIAQHLGLVGSTASTTLWTERIFSEPMMTVQGELDLDTGTTLAWKYDRRVGGGTPGGEGQSVRFRVRGDFTQPFELLALVAEVEGAELGGASG